MAGRRDSAGRTRSVSRKLAMQALYQHQLTGQGLAELRNQYAAGQEFASADPDYFQELLGGVLEGIGGLDDALAQLLDRPVQQLDPVEHAVLLIGLFELKSRPEIPYRVVINEGVELTKRFGATDGHKFVNAVLDRAARSTRALEQAAAKSAPSSHD
jgi:N utilization substance protein B